MHPTCYKQCTL